MEKRMRIALIAVVALVVVVVAINLVKQPTGQATFTPGANYGPVASGTQNRPDCVYLTADDGWDVTIKSELEFYDKLTGRTRAVQDNCESTTTVLEYHCENGKGAERLVNCPSGMMCRDGACIYA